MEQENQAADGSSGKKHDYCLTSRIMDALFFSNAVYEPTPEAALADLNARFCAGVDLVFHQGFDSSSNSQAILGGRSRSSGHLVVACRGTSGIRDVLQDLKYLPTSLSYASGWAAHWGFAERAQGVPIELLCKLVAAGERLVFTGHSLGGAVASLLTLRVLEGCGHEGSSVCCITFGAPLFASSGLAELINARHKGTFIHVMSRRDCVPKILPFVQRLLLLLYCANDGDDDHLEGLRLVRRAVELVPLIASAFRSIERAIIFSAPIGFLVRCLLKLAVPRSWYVFSGQVLMLDSSAKSFMIADSDRLNLWHSQLGLALGIGLDAVTTIEQHTMLSYEAAMLAALSAFFPSSEPCLKPCKACSITASSNQFVGIPECSRRDSRKLLCCVSTLQAIASATNAEALIGECECGSPAAASESDENRDACCRMQEVFGKIDRPHKQVASVVPRKRGFVRVGWFIGVIGRISRHLRALHSMCVLTCIRTALSSLIG